MNWPALYRAARSTVPRRVDADTTDDIASASVAKLFLARLVPDDPRAFVRTIARNVRRDYARSYHARYVVRVTSDAPDERLNALQQLCADDDALDRRVRGFLHTDISPVDIARRLRVRPGTVRTQLYRARAALRRDLSQVA